MRHQITEEKIDETPLETRRVGMQHETLQEKTLTALPLGGGKENHLGTLLETFQRMAKEHHKEL